MADFQNALTCKYLTFLGAIFCTEEIQMICRMDFDMLFAILIFEPN